MGATQEYQLKVPPVVFRGEEAIIEGIALPIMVIPEWVDDEQRAAEVLGVSLVMIGEGATRAELISEYRKLLAKHTRGRVALFVSTDSYTTKLVHDDD